MDKVDKMREKRLSVAVKLIKLIKVYASQPNIVTCVFEGEDAKYYGVRIDGFLNGIDRKNITCKGKGNLLKLKGKVESHTDLSHAKVLYFADRDFDFSDKTKDNIYFTPCYSVENLYVENSVMRRILLDEFGFCEVEDKADVTKIIEIYDQQLTLISNTLLQLNAWIMCQNNEQKIDDTIKLNLNNFDVSHFVEFDLEKVVGKYNKASLKEAFPNSVSVSSGKIDAAKSLIENSDAIKSSRGKYLLEFLRQFMDMIREEIHNEDSKVVNKRIKTRLTISKNNILSDLSQYAESPVCLRNFLSENLKGAA